MKEKPILWVLGIIGFIVLCVICRGGGLVLACCGIFLLLVFTVGKKMYEEQERKAMEEKRKFEEYWGKRWKDYYEHQKKPFPKDFMPCPPYVVNGKMTSPLFWDSNVWK